MRLIPQDDKDINYHFPPESECDDWLSNPMVLLDDTIEITDAELDEIINGYLPWRRLQTDKPFGWIGFSQYLHEWIKNKQDMKANA